MMKRFWKRITAAALSLILAVGMLLGDCSFEAKASGNVSNPYTVTTSLTLTLDGYEGEGTPEFGEVVLLLSKERGVQGSYDIIRSDQMIRGGSGTVLTYEYSFGGGKYYQIYWGIDAGKGFTGLSNASMSVSSGYLGDYRDEKGSGFKATAYRYIFMDGNDIYYEQYADRFNDIYNFDDPEKSNHAFAGWEWGDKKRIDSLNYIRSLNRKGNSTTFKAVWEHPSEDTWGWNNDADSHWKECSCGELKSEAEAHTWDEGIITKEPTETENGVKTYSCKDCGAVLRTEVVPATGAPTVSGNDSVSGNNPSKPANPDVPGNNDTPANPDVPNNNAPANNTTVNISQSNGGSSANTSVNTATTAGKNKEPKTGDTPHVEIYATVAMIAGMAYLLLYFCDDEHGMSEEEKQELMSRLIAWAKKGGYFRRIMALMAIFFLSCYYHSIGKKSYVQWQAVCGK